MSKPWTNLLRIPCWAAANASVNVVVEAPRGATSKLAFGPELGAFVFHRALPIGVAYPYDWGFIPSTRAADDDPLDAMVLYDANGWPGLVIPARPIGVVRVEQTDGKGKKARNDRILAVPVDDPRQNVADLHERAKRELEAFFVLVGKGAHDDVRVLGWDGPKEALGAIQDAHLAWGEMHDEDADADDD